MFKFGKSATASLWQQSNGPYTIFWVAWALQWQNNVPGRPAMSVTHGKEKEVHQFVHADKHLNWMRSMSQPSLSPPADHWAELDLQVQCWDEVAVCHNWKTLHLNNHRKLQLNQKHDRCFFRYPQHCALTICPEGPSQAWRTFGESSWICGVQRTGFFTKKNTLYHFHTQPIHQI